MYLGVIGWEKNFFVSMVFKSLGGIIVLECVRFWFFNCLLNKFEKEEKGLRFRDVWGVC